ncbi:MAG: DUF2735 domain-containing protein [Hyphomicrobiales bacterium]|nr:DUF2735 domain-containing protein [Alphaproteobacteria bacterium]
MTTNVTQTSATIYQFPIGGRRSVADRREQPKPATDLRLVASAALSGSWYHEAAIQDSIQTREH